MMNKPGDRLLRIDHKSMTLFIQSPLPGKMNDHIFCGFSANHSTHYDVAASTNLFVLNKEIIWPQKCLKMNSLALLPYPYQPTAPIMTTVTTMADTRAPLGSADGSKWQGFSVAKH